jgi:hypothetical protein
VGDEPAPTTACDLAAILILGPGEDPHSAQSRGDINLQERRRKIRQSPRGPGVKR